MGFQVNQFPYTKYEALCMLVSCGTLTINVKLSQWRPRFCGAITRFSNTHSWTSSRAQVQDYSSIWSMVPPWAGTWKEIM